MIYIVCLSLLIAQAFSVCDGGKRGRSRERAGCDTQERIATCTSLISHHCSKKNCFEFNNIVLKILLLCRFQALSTCGYSRSASTRTSTSLFSRPLVRSRLLLHPFARSHLLLRPLARSQLSGVSKHIGEAMSRICGGLDLDRPSIPVIGVSTFSNFLPPAMVLPSKALDLLSIS